jgi:hypothetical protein
MTQMPVIALFAMKPYAMTLYVMRPYATKTCAMRLCEMRLAAINKAVRLGPRLMTARCGMTLAGATAVETEPWTRGPQIPAADRLTEPVT